MRVVTSHPQALQDLLLQPSLWGKLIPQIFVGCCFANTGLWKCSGYGQWQYWQGFFVTVIPAGETLSLLWSGRFLAVLSLEKIMEKKKEENREKRIGKPRGSLEFYSGLPSEEEEMGEGTWEENRLHKS